MSDLSEWDSFYVIVGSSAGALIGLQFVFMTLIAERPPRRIGDASAAFTTPTVVHFSTVLLLSALLRVPWQSAITLAALWGFVGLCGAIYTAIVARRMHNQDVYKPVLEDVVFHLVLPFAAYLLLAGSAFGVTHFREALFGVGGASLMLLFIGIHNAWDSVYFHVAQKAERVAVKSEGGAKTDG